MFHRLITRRQGLGLAAAALGTLPSLSARPVPPPLSKFILPEAIAGHARNGILALDRPVIDLGDKTLIWGHSDMALIGMPGGTLVTTSAPEVLVFMDCSNCVFESIHFASTSLLPTLNSGGMISALHKTMKSVRFNNCQFSCPDLGRNAIKFVFEKFGSFGESIYFDNCEILGCGRMGLEIQNHVDDGIFRYRDIRWIGGRVADTGLIHDRLGQGISLTGLGTDCRIDTHFINNGYASFENVGASSVYFTGQASGLTRRCSPVSLSNFRNMRDCSIKNFSCIDTSTGDILIGNQNNLLMKDNHFKTSGSMRFIGVQNLRSEGEIYETSGAVSILVTQNRVEGFSQYNTWEDLRLRTGGGNRSSGSIHFKGDRTFGNKFLRLSIDGGLATSGCSQQSDGAHDNAAD